MFAHCIRFFFHIHHLTKLLCRDLAHERQMHYLTKEIYFVFWILERGKCSHVVMLESCGPSELLVEPPASKQNEQNCWKEESHQDMQDATVTLSCSSKTTETSVIVTITVVYVMFLSDWTRNSCRCQQSLPRIAVWTEVIENHSSGISASSDISRRPKTTPVCGFHQIYIGIRSD